jgi:hypothetical protein
MKKLDKQLEQIQNVEEGWLEAGILGGMVTLFGLGIWASVLDARKYPKHPKWNKMIQDHERISKKCAEYYPDNYKKVKASGGLGEASANFDYEDYQANPERIKCQMTARLNFLKKFVGWISKEKAEEICKYNTKGTERCYAYVMAVKEGSISELADLHRVLSASSKDKPLSRQQFQAIASKLNPTASK